MKVYFTEYKFVWLDENTFWQHEKKGDIIRWHASAMKHFALLLDLCKKNFQISLSFPN